MKSISAISLFAIALLGGTAVAHACDWDDDAGYRTTRVYRYAPAYSYRSYAYSPTYYDDDYYYAYRPSYYAYAPSPYLYTSFGYADGGRRHHRAYRSETRSVNFTSTIRTGGPMREHHRR